MKPVRLVWLVIAPFATARMKIVQLRTTTGTLCRGRLSVYYCYGYAFFCSELGHSVLGHRIIVFASNDAAFLWMCHVSFWFEQLRINSTLTRSRPARHVLHYSMNRYFETIFLIAKPKWLAFCTCLGGTEQSAETEWIQTWRISKVYVNL